MFLRTPPMGWNSWNTFGEGVSADVVCESADALCRSGLAAAGYKYVVIDDGWAERERDSISGRIVPDRKKFPDGMKAVSDYVHSLGLKLGIYSCAGVRTCGNFPGSYGHEFLDAETFAEYGCDFLKYDFCYFPDVADCATAYRRMGNALRAAGREILFSACCWGKHDVHRWARSAGADTFRSTWDMRDNFESFAAIIRNQWNEFCYSGPGCFNDLDMLTVGIFGNSHIGSQNDVYTLEQYRTQFGMWCMYGTPLMLGNDVRSMTPEIAEILTNRELIAVNQDPECRPPFLTYSLPANASPDVYVLARLLADGDLAIGFFHCRNTIVSADVGATNFSLLFENIGFPADSGYGLHFRDLYTGEDLGVKKEIFTCHDLQPRHCRVFRATPVKC